MSNVSGILDELHRAARMIGDADTATGRVPAPATGERSERVRQLEERLDQLTLVCAAMWQLVREKTNLTEQDLAERIAIIDAKDGVADGKMTRVVDKCPKCSRTMSPKHKRCLYCGFQKPFDTAFSQI